MGYDAQRERARREHGRHPSRADGNSVPVMPLLIDCDTCQVRGIGCGDCVITMLLGGPPQGVSLNDEERRAVEVLAAAGLVPPLRLVEGIAGEVVDSA